ncbi:MAG: phosphoribosylglycinamide formyltransferase [Thermaurantiacus sp.]
MADGKRRARLAILISGRGSNMEALIKAAQTMQDYPAEPVLVISNREDAVGLDVAQALGVPTATIPSRGRSREAFEAELDSRLRASGPGVVALAGFMRILSAGFIAGWRGRIVNIHPSLLPKYPGLDTHARAIRAGDTVAGATVHLVTEEVDSGPVLAQAKVPVLPDDTTETLAARVLEAEHQLYPKALADFLQQRTAPGDTFRRS